MNGLSSGLWSLLKVSAVIMLGLAAILAVLALGLTAILWPDAARAPTLINVQSSPSGQWTVENYQFLYDATPGYLIIRKTDEKEDTSDILAHESWGNLFFVWNDETHLTITHEADTDPPFKGPDEFKGIHITYSDFKLTPNALTIGDSANLSIREVAADHVTASASVEKIPNGILCHLNVQARDGTTYDTAEFTMSARINACGIPRIPCAGIESVFHLNNRLDGHYGKLLTSSTVSNVRSYNRVPDGEGQNTIRGQFLDDAAEKLLASIKSKSFDLQYSINWGEENISYRIPTQSIKETIQKFFSCVGDGDFQWTKHVNKGVRR